MSSERVERDGCHTVPVDVVARRVVGKAPSWHHRDAVPFGDNNLGKTRPMTVNVPRYLEDLRGQRHGRVEIVGYIGHNDTATRGSTNGRHKFWLGLCDCGTFVKRVGRTWRRAKHSKAQPDMCQPCRSHAKLQRLARQQKKPRGREWDRCPNCGRKYEDVLLHISEEGCEP